MYNFSMCLQQIVSAQIGGNAREVHCWCHVINTISLLTNMPWFINCRPYLESIEIIFEKTHKSTIEYNGHFGGYSDAKYAIEVKARVLICKIKICTSRH